MQVQRWICTHMVYHIRCKLYHLLNMKFYSVVYRRYASTCIFVNFSFATLLSYQQSLQRQNITQNITAYKDAKYMCSYESHISIYLQNRCSEGFISRNLPVKRPGTYDHFYKAVTIDIPYLVRQCHVCKAYGSSKAVRYRRSYHNTKL